MKLWQWFLSSVIFSLLLSGIIWLVASPPRGKPVELQPLPTPSPITIYVTGSIVQPGVYSLPVNSRVVDAVDAAGGLQADADANLLNLAALLVDGQRLWVPAKTGESASPNPGNAGGIYTPTAAAPLSEDHPLNINQAAEAQLELLPGIGPVKAAAIIAYRNQYGPFIAIEDLQNVPGITASVYEKIKSLIAIAP